MLKIENISYSYGRNKRPALQDYSLEMKEGAIYGLLGKNGAGKSTLLYLVTGLLKPQTGHISYDGMTPWQRKVEFLNDVFIVPEEFFLPNVTLRNFIATTSPFYPNFSMDDLRHYLDTFELTPDVHLGQLSMGQKKRVFISFALACNTSLLILDEPTNGLDIPGKRLFRKAILKGMTDKKTIIISTHQVYDVEKIIDHVIITDNDGVLLDQSIYEVTSKLSFSFTTDRNRAEHALVALDAPGGYNIIEPNEGDYETEINLETLFEFTRENPKSISKIFNS